MFSFFFFKFLKLYLSFVYFLMGHPNNYDIYDRKGDEIIYKFELNKNGNNIILKHRN